ncbi:hypothetical protein ILUMI_25901 [Ignelater luminosus]|uniref:Uncharacterized protein n=1 Tax=Ignelater luminosus TaxID=2038154 RepID=A0A8K0C913_IGNLU|nr:hypothetical protein ILUMI_25901 [Ignelater luminosus]
MKVCLLLLSAFYGVLAENLTVTEIHKLWRVPVAAFQTECMCQTGVKQEIVDAFYKYGEMPDDACWKCFIYCLGVKTGILNADAPGAFDIQLWSRTFVYADLPLAQKCANTVEPDPCPYFATNDAAGTASVNGERCREQWFQQDGATSHTAGQTLEMPWDNFYDRVISRRTLFNYPSHINKTTYTRIELFEIWLQPSLSAKNKRKRLKDSIFRSFDEAATKIYKLDVTHRLGRFCTELEKRWKASFRKKGLLSKKNADWFKGEITFVSSTTHSEPSTSFAGRPTLTFSENSERSKRRKTEELRKKTDLSELSYAMKMQLGSERKHEAAKVLDEALNSSPVRAALLCSPQVPLHPDRTDPQSETSDDSIGDDSD